MDLVTAYNILEVLLGGANLKDLPLRVVRGPLRFLSRLRLYHRSITYGMKARERKGDGQKDDVYKKWHRGQ